MDAGCLTPECWEEPDKEGVLGHMVGLFSKSKESKYVRLKGNRFFIFEDDSPQSEEVEAHIPLGDVEIFTTQSFVTKFGPHCFCLYSKRHNQRYFLIAGSAEEREEWVEALSHASAASLSRAPSEGALLGDPNAQKSPRSRKLSKNTAASGEPIRTLFVTGWPADVKEREVHSVFRLLPGYEGCKINYGEQPVAFVAFSELRHAQHARRLLNGVRYDPFAANVIRITYAKQNSKSKSLPAEFYPRWNEPDDESGKQSAPTSASSSANHSRRASVNADTTSSGNGSGATVSKSVAVPERGTRIIDPSTIEKLKHAFGPDPASKRHSVLFEEGAEKGASAALLSPVRGGFGVIGDMSPNRRSLSDSPETSVSAIPVIVSSSPTASAATPIAGTGAGTAPCSTLFVGNLHPEITEADLHQLFSLIPGFKQLKLYVGHDSLPVSFVEYENETQSTLAMQALRGVYLGPTRLRIEYARSKMSSKGTGLNSRKHSQGSLPVLEDHGAPPTAAPAPAPPKYYSPLAAPPDAPGDAGIPLLSSGKLSFGSLF